MNGTGEGPDPSPSGSPHGSPPGSPPASPPASPLASPPASRRGSPVSDDEVEYIPPTGDDIPNTYEFLLYHYNKLLTLYNRLKRRQTSIPSAEKLSNGVQDETKEGESELYTYEIQPSAFKSEHQPPGMTRNCYGEYVIEHLNVIGSGDVKSSPSDRVLGEGNFGVVQESSYHLAKVAVKKLKRDVSASALDEFAHETLMNV